MSPSPSLFVSIENRFFKVIKPRKCVSNDIISCGVKVNIRVELFSIIELTNYVVRHSIVCGDVDMVRMNVWNCCKKHCAELCQNHDNGEQFFVTNNVFELGIIEFAGPEGHRFVILDDISAHFIAGGISVNVKGFIVVWIHMEAILYHEIFHAFENKVHFRSPTKVVFPGWREVQECEHVEVT